MLKKLAKKSVAMLLAAIMAVSCTVTAFAATIEDENVGGAVTNLVLGEMSTLLANTIERPLVYALSETATAENNPKMTKALNWAGRIIGGYEGAALGEITVMCEEILEELNTLTDTVNDSTRSLNAGINQIITTLDKNEYKAIYDNLSPIYSLYSKVLYEYETLVGYLKAYSEEQTSVNKNKLEQQYNKIDNMFNDEQLKVQINFPTELNTILSNISAYEYTYDYSKYTDDNNDSIFDYPYNDSEYWGNRKPAVTTYLDALYNLSVDIMPLESITYENLKGGTNYVADLSFVYLSVYSMYVEFEVQKINADASLDDKSREQKISSLWDDYNKSAYMLCRGLEQMVYQYENQLNTFMRPYDTEVSVDMEYSSSHSYDMGGGHTATTKVTDKVKSSMYAYQFKPVNSSVAYLLRKSEYGNSGNNAKLLAGDMVEVTDNDYTFDFGFSEHIRYLSSDFQNLKKSTSPSGYNMITSVEDIYSILDTTAFKSNADGYLMPFLKTQLQYALISSADTENIDKVSDISINIPSIESKASNQDTLKAGQFMMLNSPVDWDPVAIIPNYDADTTWLNISQPLSKAESNDNEVYIDVEGNITDEENVSEGEVAVMLSGNPTVNFTVERWDGGECDVRVGDSENLYGTSQQKSGSKVTVKIKPDEDRVVDNIILLDEDDEVLENLFSFKEIIPEEYFKCLSVDEEGFYTFEFPVPYQDAKLKVTYKGIDESYNDYTVKLNNVDSDNDLIYDDGKISFVLNSCSEELTFCQGETVGVKVHPYDNNLCTGISVVTERGETVKVTDITNTTLVSTPTDKEYEFVMPAENVNVYAEFKKGYTVTLNNKANNGAIKFSENISNTYNYDLTKPITFTEGDLVEINSAPDSSYYLSKISITGDYSYNKYIYSHSDGTIKFYMPAENVTVVPTFEAIVGNSHTVKLNYEGLCTLEFDDDDCTNCVEKAYDAGSEVNVKFTESVKVISFSIKDINNKDIEYTEKDGIYTFTMPNSNVIVYAQAESHKYVNGFCKMCGDYEPAEKNEDGVYEISNAGQLYWFGALTKKDTTHATFTKEDLTADNTISAELVDNIKVNDDIFNDEGEIDKDTSSLRTWTPLFDNESLYNGTFDGNGYSISNLYISNTGSDMSGFFNCIGFNGVVKNVNFENLYLEVNDYEKDLSIYAGGISAFNYGTISNCSVSGLIDFKDSAHNDVVGGISGGNMGTISNCNNDCTIKALSDNVTMIMGGISGVNFMKGNITNSHNIGDIISYAWLTMAGGIAGFDNKSISKSYNEGDIYISNISAAGGISGLGSGEINDCYNKGDVISDTASMTTEEIQAKMDEWNKQHDESHQLDKDLDYYISAMGVGGIFGFGSSGVAKNCYNIGNVSGLETYAGPIYGVDEKQATVDNCYYLVSDDTDITDDSMKHLSDFESGEVAYLLNGGENGVTDGTQIWYQSIDNKLEHDSSPILVKYDQNTVYKVDLTNKTYSNYEDGVVPIGLDTDENGNFIIKTYEDLCNMATLVNRGDEAYTKGSYILVNDIDCSGNTWRTPIGTSSHPFKGTFDGQNYTIDSLTIKSDLNGKIALFGVVDGGTIKNLNLSNASVNVSSGSNNYISTICSILTKGTISNCSAGGKIILNNNQLYTLVGGICAKAESSVIEKCMSYVDIDIFISFPNGYENYYVGGICGDATKGQINNCAYLSSITESKHLKVTSSAITNGDVVSVQNCYTTCTGSLDYPVSSSEKIDNCYYLVSDDTSITDSSMKHKAQFEFGEVAYLLNGNKADGKQAWYQNIDNGLTPDDYPVLTNNDQNTVYYTGAKSKLYSNYLYNKDQSYIEASDLRTYQRIILENGHLSEKSQIAYEYGTVDHINKVITVYMADTAERMGVLMHQGVDGKAGVMKLQGDYPNYLGTGLTSEEILKNNIEEPDIYTDGNGCIFITLPEDGKTIPELTVSYTQKPVENYESTLYTLKVKVIDANIFTQIGGTITDTLDKDDPDYAVVSGGEETTTLPTPSEDANSSTADETSKETVITDNSVVQTGSPINSVIFLDILLAGFVVLFAYRRKNE